MIDPVRTYKKGERREETWYEGVLAPGAPRDDEGKQALAGERQGNLIGVAPGFWSDAEHAGIQGSFGDIGSVELKRNGEVVGQSGWPFGVFTVPAEDSAYELTLDTRKIGSKVWNRSTETRTTWAFRSHLDEEVYSQGIPMLFPHYELPEDGLKTLAADDGQRITLTATGHAGLPARSDQVRVSVVLVRRGQDLDEGRDVRRSGGMDRHREPRGCLGQAGLAQNRIDGREQQFRHADRGPRLRRALVT